MNELNRRLNCLYLVVDETVAKDIHMWVMTALAETRADGEETGYIAGLIDAKEICHGVTKNHDTIFNEEANEEWLSEKCAAAIARAIKHPG